MTVLLDVLLAGVFSVIGFVGLFQFSSELLEDTANAKTRLQALSALVDLEGRSRMAQWQFSEPLPEALNCNGGIGDWLLAWCQRWQEQGLGSPAVKLLVETSSRDVTVSWQYRFADQRLAWQQSHRWQVHEAAPMGIELGIELGIE